MSKTKIKRENSLCWILLVHFVVVGLSGNTRILIFRSPLTSLCLAHNIHSHFGSWLDTKKIKTLVRKKIFKKCFSRLESLFLLLVYNYQRERSGGHGGQGARRTVQKFASLIYMRVFMSMCSRSTRLCMVLCAKREPLERESVVKIAERACQWNALPIRASTVHVGTTNLVSDWPCVECGRCVRWLAFSEWKRGGFASCWLCGLQCKN